MKKTISLIICLTFALMVSAQPANYYNSANGLTGNQLKVALHNIIKGHESISYSQLWNAFWSTDNKGNGVVWDMYSDRPNGTPPYTYYLGQDQCGNYNSEGDCYNREHSWPSSWFNDQTTPRTDLHHIFPTDGFVNNKRGNYPFGEVRSASWTSQNGSKLGPCKTSGYSGTVFEPIDEYKGDFARAIMYMSVRYYTEDSDWGSSGMTNKSEIKDWAMTMLLRWSDEDPVSQKEIDRNNAVYGCQNNRNPFIDHPEYARMIWDSNWHGGGSIGAGDYVKVTSSDEITDGDYLIVCESNNVAFNGGLTSLDGVGNTIGVTITDDVIAATDETNAAYFTITAKTGGGYSIKSASGYYIGQTSNANGLASSPTVAYSNSITLNGTDIDISSGGAYLRYNANSDQTRFRYFKSSTYTVQQAIQLYKKAETYSITLATVEHGSISANAEEASEGSTITLTATPDEGYELDSWTVTDDQNNAIAVTENQFVMPASDVTVSATFIYVGQPFEQKYYLVTSTDQLVAGRTYLIVNTAAGKALGTTQNNNNRAAVDVTIASNVIESIDNTVCELALGGSTGAWTFFDANWNNNGGYLYAASSSSNQLKTQASNNTNGQWSISFDNDGMASVVAQGSNTRNNLRYNPNNGSPIFNCYASTSNMALVQLFIRSEEYNITENTTIANLFPFDKHTVCSGTTLTVSGTATCNEASQLIIEDGAQLVHHNDGVKALMKKSVTGYVGNTGWYTFANPFTDLDLACLTTADYDLYTYVEDAELEWYNYKAHQNDFMLNPGYGYLYAHNPSATLRLNGTLNNGDFSTTIPLSHDSNNAGLCGFNLLGNPTAHDISFTKTDAVSLVKANANGETVTLNPQGRGESREKGQYLCLNVGKEKAYVKLDEGVSMPLMGLNGQHAALYFTQGQKRFAMLVRDGAGALDLSFEVRQNGVHTLSVDTQGLDLEYLH